MARKVVFIARCSPCGWKRVGDPDEVVLEAVEHLAFRVYPPPDGSSGFDPLALIVSPHHRVEIGILTPARGGVPAAVKASDEAAARARGKG